MRERMIYIEPTLLGRHGENQARKAGGRWRGLGGEGRPEVRHQWGEAGGDRRAGVQGRGPGGESVSPELRGVGGQYRELVGSGPRHQAESQAVALCGPTEGLLSCRTVWSGLQAVQQPWHQRENLQWEREMQGRRNQERQWEVSVQSRVQWRAVWSVQWRPLREFQGRSGTVVKTEESKLLIARTRVNCCVLPVTSHALVGAQVRFHQQDNHSHDWPCWHYRGWTQVLHCLCSWIRDEHRTRLPGELSCCRESGHV